MNNMADQMGRLVVAVESSDQTLSIVYATELYQYLIALNPEHSVRLVFAADVNCPSGGPLADVAHVTTQRTFKVLSDILKQDNCRCVIVPDLYQCHRFAAAKGVDIPSTTSDFHADDSEPYIEPDLVIFIARDQDDPVVDRFLRLASSAPVKHCAVFMSSDPFIRNRMMEMVSHTVMADDVLDQMIKVPIYI